MGVNETLCLLGGFLDEWDRDVITIRSVTVSEEGGTDGRTVAEVSLDIPVVSAEGDAEEKIGYTPTISSGGTLGVTLETDLSIPESENVADVEPVDATINADGTATVAVNLILAETDEHAIEERSTGSRPSETRQRRAESTGNGQTKSRTTERKRDVAPFKDQELLQEIYETHDTFAEMADALDMDVTGETVRRYMIDYDIHQPNSYQTASPETTDSPGTDDQEMVVLSDGIGLPENVDIEDLIETVNRSNTIYEVKEDLDLERSEAHSMLKELNLVDLVMGRLTNDKSTDITREDVVDRLRDVSQARAT